MRRIWLVLVTALVVTMGAALLPTVTPAEANGTNIVVLGGSGAVSDSVLSELATCTSGSVSRIAGSNRYATAAAVSSKFLSPGVDVAYVATGENFPDALAGSAAAGAGAGGPILLVRPTSVPSETAAELNRLNPNTIVVLGGTAAISTGVETALGAYGTVVRVAGSNRYSTGALVSSYAFPTGANTAYVATGTNFPDALAGGPAAVVANGPVLLVDPNSIPSSVGTELARLGLSSIKVLGGTAAVSASVEEALKAYAPSVTRLSGSNRYATAAAVSKDTFAPGVGTIFIATGTNFPDALAGGPVAGILGGPILLTDPNSIPADTKAEIQRLTGTTCTSTTPPPTKPPAGQTDWVCNFAYPDGVSCHGNTDPITPEDESWDCIEGSVWGCAGEIDSTDIEPEEWDCHATSETTYSCSGDIDRRTPSEESWTCGMGSFFWGCRGNIDTSDAADETWACSFLANNDYRCVGDYDKGFAGDERLTCTNKTPLGTAWQCEGAQSWLSPIVSNPDFLLSSTLKPSTAMAAYLAQFQSSPVGEASE